MSDLLQHYLDAWFLSDPQPLATTPTSHVYTVLHEGQRVVLKCLTPYGFEERQGAKALRCFNGQGAVRLLRYDDDAHLLEYADGESLTGMVNAGDDDGATRIIADVLNQLHAAPSNPASSDITTLQSWFASLLKKADQDRQSGSDSVYIQAAAIAEDLLAHPQDECVLHGDIHHENIRYRDQRGWLAFDPKGLYGERTFDTANIFRNPYPYGTPNTVINEARILRTAETLAQAMNIDAPRILAFTFAFACLSASWILNDGDDPIEDLAIASIIQPHLPSL